MRKIYFLSLSITFEIEFLKSGIGVQIKSKRVTGALRSLCLCGELSTLTFTVYLLLLSHYYPKIYNPKKELESK
jgi:hypothetical protein